MNNIGRVYFCGYFTYPRGEAGANYIYHLAKVFRAMGWKTYVISNVNHDSCPSERISVLEGVTIIPCELPKGRIRHYIDFNYRKGAYIRHGLRRCGVCSNDLIIAYSRDPGVLRIARDEAHKAGARCGVCVVEWFDETDFPKGKRDSGYRRSTKSFNHINETFDFILPISTGIASFYERRHCRTFCIPCLTDASGYVWKDKCMDGRRRVIYPANGKMKDALPQMLEAFALLTEEEQSRIEFHLCGCEKTAPELMRKLGLEDLIDRVVIIHPWMAYAELTKLYEEAHFMLLARGISRMTRSNFPSKIPETMTYGVIPICSRVGDYTEYYLRDGVDSLQMDGCTAEIIAARLRDALAMTDEEVNVMSKASYHTAEERFDCNVWSSDLNTFLEDIS